MKIVRRPESTDPAASQPRLEPWKVLIVDDEPDVRRFTVLNLRGFQFGGRSLQCLEASTAAQAQTRLHNNPYIALARSDVVMCTD